MLHKKLFGLILLMVAAFSFGLVTMAQDEEDGAVLELNLLHDGDVVEGELSEDAPTLLYVFNANEGDEVTISMVQTDDLDPFLALLGPAGEVIAVNDDVDYDNDDYSSLLEDIELPETGTYFVIASSYTYFVSNEFDEDPQGFELTIDGISEVEEMGDGFLFFAAELVDGEPLVAEISEEQASWYFVFEGAEGDVVSVSAESEDFDTVVSVFAPLGVRVGVNDDIDYDNGDLNSLVEEIELPADGVYLVIVGNPYLLFRGMEDATESDFGEFEVELTFE